MKNIRLSLFSLAFLIHLISFGQERNNSIILELGGSPEYEETDKLFFGAGHEWCLNEYLGLQVMYNKGSLKTLNEWQDYDWKTSSYFPGYNSKDVQCKYESLSLNLKGYLHLFYNDDDIPQAYLFSRVKAGAVIIKAKGELNTRAGQCFRTSNTNNPQFYTGLDLGIGMRVAKRVRLELAAGGNDIRFKRATMQLDKLNPNFPFHFKTSNTLNYTFTLRIDL
jgi:hypothetical protein